MAKLLTIIHQNRKQNLQNFSYSPCKSYFPGFSLSPDIITTSLAYYYSSLNILLKILILMLQICSLVYKSIHIPCPGVFFGLATIILEILR